MQNLIEIKNLEHVYTDTDGNEVKALEVKALAGVSLSIAKGEFVAIIGANGSGKSTLARHLNALLLPTAGKCIVAGMDTADDDNLWNIRQHVGMVFQNPDNQIVAAIVEEDVAFGPENIGVPPAEIRTRVDRNTHPCGCCAGCRGHDGIRQTRAAFIKRRAEAARGDCRCAGAGAGLHCFRRADGDAGPARARRNCRHGEKAEPRKTHYRCLHNALYGRSHAGRPHYRYGKRQNKIAGHAERGFCPC